MKKGRSSRSSPATPARHDCRIYDIFLSLPYSSFLNTPKGNLTHPRGSIITRNKVPRGLSRLWAEGDPTYLVSTRRLHHRRVDWA